MPSDSVWMRDYGPHFVWQGGADAIVDSHYYPDRPLDNFIPTLLADDYFVNPSYDIPLYYSGGNFQASANRHGFVTELIFEDNPGLDESAIAALYGRFQGIDTLHVLPQLPPSVDGTGHIDMWLYLVDEDTVIISEFLPGSNQEAIDITNNAVPYMQALGYEVIRTPAFNAQHPFGPTHYTYTNAFRVNDRIFLTTYGQGNPAYVVYDNQAIAAWQQAAGPGVEIVPINAYTIIWASGAFHCIVMQVPRHVDTLPSACATSPVGGEFLVPNTLHEITWTAADNVSISTVDLSYSVDGGLTYPPDQVIATGLADDGSHAWTVPLVETPQARVRVLARDNAGNAVEAASEGDVLIESAFRRVYDFSTGAGVDRFAWGDKTTSWAQIDGVRRPVNNQLSAANYTKLSASDATTGVSDPNRYVSTMTAPADFEAEATHVFEFTIAEDPALIRDIGLRWEGFAADCTQMELYVWDYVAGQWCDGRGQCGRDHFVDSFAGSRDEDLAGAIRGDFQRYISASGQLTLLLYAERSFDRSYHDYVSATVTYDECLGADPDFDGWGRRATTAPRPPTSARRTPTGTSAEMPATAPPATAPSSTCRTRSGTSACSPTGPRWRGIPTRATPARGPSTRCCRGWPASSPWAREPVRAASPPGSPTPPCRGCRPRRPRPATTCWFAGRTRAARGPTGSTRPASSGSARRVPDAPLPPERRERLIPGGPRAPARYNPGPRGAASRWPTTPGSRAIRGKTPRPGPRGAGVRPFRRATDRRGPSAGRWSPDHRCWRPATSSASATRSRASSPAAAWARSTRPIDLELQERVALKTIRADARRATSRGARALPARDPARAQGHAPQRLPHLRPRLDADEVRRRAASRS